MPRTQAVCMGASPLALGVLLVTACVVRRSLALMASGLALICLCLNGINEMLCLVLSGPLLLIAYPSAFLMVCSVQ